MMQLLSLPGWQATLLYLGAYVVLDFVSYVFPLATFGITPWNPPTGLSIALIVLMGRSYWPLLFVGPLAADLIVRRMPLPLEVELAAVGVLGVGYSLATMMLTHPKLKFDPSLPTLRDLFVLLGIGGLAAAAVAFAYVAVFASVGLLPWTQYLAAVVHHWVGDAIGIFVVTPFLLSMVTATRRPNPSLEMVAQLGAVVLVLWVTFTYSRAIEFQFFYLLFLPIIWVAVRYGLLGVTAALFLTQTGLVLAMHWTAQSVGDVTRFQILMLILALTGLLLGSMITEQRRVQDRLRLHQDALGRASRLTTLSVLAATLAHEVNQPLTAVSNYTRLLRDMIKSGEGQTAVASETVEKAISHIDHAGRLVRQIREFVRTGRTDAAPVALTSLVEDAIALARPLLDGANVQVTVRSSAGPTAVLADRLQIEHLLLNLLNNSVEAIADAGQPQGNVTIVIRQSLEPGLIEIQVIDNGPGFSPEILDEAASAFATTKLEGTGLGLTLCRSIVEKHGGRLILANEPSGATVAFTLPQTDGPGHAR